MLVLKKRMGKVTTNPRKKGKRKRERKGQTPQKGNHYQNQTGSPDEETGQHTLSDFGSEGQRVQFVGDVQRHDDGFEAPREDHTNYVSCVHRCGNAMSQHLDAKVVRNFRRASD